MDSFIENLFEILPNEKLLEILLKLDLQSLANLCSTNKDFNQFCKDFSKDIYGPFLKKDFPAFKPEEFEVKDENYGIVLKQLHDGLKKGYCEDFHVDRVEEPFLFWKFGQEPKISYQNRKLSIMDAPIETIVCLFVPLDIAGYDSSQHKLLILYNRFEEEMALIRLLVEREYPITTYDIIEELNNADYNTLLDTSLEENDEIVREFPEIQFPATIGYQNLLWKGFFPESDQNTDPRLFHSVIGMWLDFEFVD